MLSTKMRRKILGLLLLSSHLIYLHDIKAILRYHVENAKRTLLSKPRFCDVV